MSVSSNQSGIHEDLANLVERYQKNAWRKPIRAHNEQAFSAADVWRAQRTVILDSCCGTGLSTVALAERFPQHAVIGLDKSIDRLSRKDKPSLPTNCLLIRTDVEDFWRLVLAADWPVVQHYLLYPNPWPKRAQIQRRWQAHPVFPVLTKLSRYLELRTNWQIYAEEFAYAVACYGLETELSRLELADEPPLTAFERKYSARGECLWRLTTGFGAADNSAQQKQSLILGKLVSN